MLTLNPKITRSKKFSLARLTLIGVFISLLLTFFAVQPAFGQDAPKTDEPVAAAPTAPAVTLSPDGATNAVAVPAPADEAAKAAFEAGITQEPASSIAGVVAHNQASLNMVWTLVCGFLVMFMQAGFAMVEAGFCRAKHAAHVIMTNFMIYPIGMLGFWAVGFGLMFGNFGAVGTMGGQAILDGGFKVFGDYTLFGTKGFFLNPSVYDTSVYALFLFQMVFMDTTATIPTGAMAERWRFGAFIVYGFVISTIIYPIYGHWLWGYGWLAQLGHLGLGGQKFGVGAVDFAGSSVVHAVGGFVALAGARALGPRIGKFNKDGSGNTLAAHHIPMAVIGTFILAFGWFGFNAGSTLAGTDNRIAVVAVNTMLASASGAMIGALVWHFKTKKWDPGMMVNGMLAGLVAITAPCAFVDAGSAVVIGAIAGVLVIWSIGFWEKQGLDDPVGAVSVHGVCGIFGMLSVGFFADGKYSAGVNAEGAMGPVVGLLNGGGAGQLIAQLIACIVCITWAFGTGTLWFWIQGKFMKLRPTEAEELEGLDIPEMGVLAYPEFDKAKA